MWVRCVFLGAAATLAVTIMVALASASPSTSKKATAHSGAAASTPAATSWLPAGSVPAGAMWPTSGGDIDGASYSTLTQIGPSNVSKLKIAWQLAPLNIPGSNLYKPENQPLVLVDGQKGVTNMPMSTTMFMQTNYGMVALDPTNGNILWQYKGANSKGKNAAGVIPTNGIGARAIAYGDGMIFGGQQDGSLVAVNSKTGAPVWTVDTEAAGSNAEGNVFGESNPWSIFDPSADTAWTKGSGLKQDLVFSAPNGGESPMRGHFDAFDAKTGVLVWRFWATPDPTQLPFILTWGNPAEAASGGGACWSLPAVDNTLGMAYFGCGNHFPEDGQLARARSCGPTRSSRSAPIPAR